MKKEPYPIAIYWQREAFRAANYSRRMRDENKHEQAKAAQKESSRYYSYARYSFNPLRTLVGFHYVG